MITSEEARKVLETIGDVFTEEKEIAPYKSLKLNTYEEYKTLINYITQQEKVNELLGLKDDLIKLEVKCEKYNNYIYHYKNIDRFKWEYYLKKNNYYLRQRNYLRKIIKGLESELNDNK